MRNLLWIFLLPASIGLSQSSHYWIKTVVQEVTNPEPGVWKLTIHNPGGLVLSDSTGFIVGSPQSSPYRNQNLSSVFITTITDQTLTASASTYDELKPGDLIYLKANLPANVSYAGILLDLVAYGIIFNDSGGKPYYSAAEIFKGNKSGEELVLNKMQEDVRKHKSNNSNIIAAGINKGKPIKEVVSQSTIETIRGFFNYSTRLPQIFSEPNINLVIELERWIQNGSIDMSALDLILKAGGEKLSNVQTESSIRELLIHLTNAASVHYNFNNKPEELVAALSQLSTLAANFLTSNDLGFFYFNYGSALHSIKKYKESLTQYGLSSQAYETHDPIQYARAISRQAECIEQLDDFQGAINGYTLAVDLWKNEIQSTPSPYHYSRLQTVLEGLARCQEGLSKNQEYITTQLSLAAVFKKLNLLNNRGNAFWNIGYTYGVKLEDPSSSNQFYEQAYQVFDSVKNVASAVTVICNQAINYRINKDYIKALEMGQRAEAYARANLNDVSEAYALENILSTLKAQEKNDKALEIALRLDRIYTQLNDVKTLASTKDEVASLYAGLSKNKEAAKVAEEAVKIYETFDNGKDLAYAYWNAGYYLDATRWQESNAYYEKAFEYFKDNSTKNATTLLSNIAINYREIKDSAKSFPQHKKAVDFARSRGDTASLIYAHEKFYHTYAHFLDYKGMEERPCKWPCYITIKIIMTRQRSITIKYWQ